MKTLWVLMLFVAALVGLVNVLGAQHEEEDFLKVEAPKHAPIQPEQGRAPGALLPAARTERATALKGIRTDALDRAAVMGATLPHP